MPVTPLVHALQVLDALGVSRVARQKTLTSITCRWVPIHPARGRSWKAPALFGSGCSTHRAHSGAGCSYRLSALIEAAQTRPVVRFILTS